MEAEIKKNRTYDLIYVDPPWDLPFVREYYDVLTKKQLLSMQVGKLAHATSVLFMWTVTNKLLEAIELMNKWGFYFVDVAFVWIKVTKNNVPHFGLGKTSTRRNSEFVLMGMRYGANVPERKSKSVPQVLFEERKAPFSRKPDVVRKLISELFHHNSKIELFARKFPDSQFTEGWTLYNKTLIQDPKIEKKKRGRVDTVACDPPRERVSVPPPRPSTLLRGPVPSLFRDAQGSKEENSERPA